MPPKEKLKLGVIGTGKMGGLHLQKFLAVEVCEVVGIYDADFERCRLLSEQTHVKAFSKMEELIFESDAVVIASSSHTHYAIAKQALNAGLHVLVEKPLAMNAEEAKELAHLSEAKKLVLQVGFVERFRLRELLKSTRLSKIRQIECERITESIGREPGVDVVTDLMIHDLDLILSLGLGKIKSVKSKGTEVLHKTTDVAVADLEFDSGTSVHLIANRLGPQASRKMRIVMAGGYCKIDLNLSKVTEVTKQGVTTVETGKDKDFLLEQAKGFCEAVNNSSLPLVSAEHGTVSIELVEKILQGMNAVPLSNVRSELSAREN